MAIAKKTSNLTFTGNSRSSVFAAWSPYTFSFANSFSQASIGRADWRDRLGGGDVGGPWFMESVQYSASPTMMNSSKVVGPMAGSTVVGWSVAQDPQISDSQMISDGTKAIGLASPTNPSFSLAQALGEAREGAPKLFGSSLLKEKSRFLKGSGSEYLNVEFGWKPLVSDLQKFAHTVKNHDKILEGYRAGSGKKLRRRFAYPPTQDSRITSGGIAMIPANASELWTGTTHEQTVTRAWFSGAFRYHVPVDDGLLGNLKSHVSEANKLLGVRLTPDVVWNLAPWSWGLDWFANTGDVMTNISNLGTDGLAMQYGYSMRSSVRERTTSWTVPASHSDASVRGTSGFLRRTHTLKRRIPASPYGFATTFDGLSNRQKAICAAIGITRAR